MQDRYVGDVGDFGKFGMIRQIAGSGLRVGVNWYRTYKPEEHHNNDGKYISYFDNKLFEQCDDGLLVKSVSLTSSKSDKYITMDELISYYLSGKSVIFYNHRCREKEEVYLQKFKPLQLQNELMSAKWKGLKFARGSVRDFIFILQPIHFEKINNVIEKMMQSNWNRHFSILNIKRDPS